MGKWNDHDLSSFKSRDIRHIILYIDQSLSITNKLKLILIQLWAQ